MNLLWGNFMSYLCLIIDVISQVLAIKSKRYFDVWEPFDGPETWHILTLEDPTHS